MIRSIVIGSLAFVAQIALAEDLCLDIQCPDCNSTPAPQYIRLIDSGPTIWTGYVQANDNSFGYPMVGILKGSDFVFARYNNGKDTQYLYDVDLTSWDGSSAVGTRYRAKYRLKSDGSGTEYQQGSSNQLRVELISCP